MTLQAEGKSLDNNTETLLERIDLVTKYQKPYIVNSLKRMGEKSACNVKVICDYIMAEQNAINIKESTKEGKIKCLVRFSTYLNHKPLHNVSRQDVLDYLTSLKKPESTDPQHKSIGTYNGRQMILLKFFRWLYHPNESDARKRTTPDCMNGVRRLPRMEKSAYKPSDLWSEEEHEIFLKYCPSARDKAFHFFCYKFLLGFTIAFMISFSVMIPTSFSRTLSLSVIGSLRIFFLLMISIALVIVMAELPVTNGDDINGLIGTSGLNSSKEPTILTTSLSVIIPTGTVPSVVGFTITTEPTLLSYILLQTDFTVEFISAVITFLIINFEIGNE